MPSVQIGTVKATWPNFCPHLLSDLSEILHVTLLSRCEFRENPHFSWERTRSDVYDCRLGRKAQDAVIATEVKRITKLLLTVTSEMA